MFPQEPNEVERGSKETGGSDEAPVQPGQLLGGKYRIESLLGMGGVGFVVSATHIQLQERVAIKFLRRESLLKPDVIARFAKEARAAVKMKGEHVAHTFDVGTLDDGSPFIVMEYLEGRDLARELAERGRLPVKDVVEYALHACEALAEAHALRIVHRDIKPDNLFLVRRGSSWPTIKVLDFGISKAQLTEAAGESKQALTRTMSLMGSPVYMSPEQIRGSRSIDHRSDIWSLGIVLYELLTNSVPFSADSVTELAALILEEPAPSLLALCPEISQDLQAIIHRCLEKDPAKRYQNVAELAMALVPFGPKRARHSAERASLFLIQTGVLQNALHLPPSIPPVPASAPTPHSLTGTILNEGETGKKHYGFLGGAATMLVLAALVGGLSLHRESKPTASASPAGSSVPAVGVAEPQPVVAKGVELTSARLASKENAPMGSGGAEGALTPAVDGSAKETHAAALTSAPQARHRAELAPKIVAPAARSAAAVPLKPSSVRLDIGY